jgi:hypothetical protein
LNDPNMTDEFFKENMHSEFGIRQSFICYKCG